MMHEIIFDIASLRDAPAIMSFMDQHWKRGHVLSWSENLLLRDFQDRQHPNRLNFGLAKHENGDLLGIFGFMFYNERAVPDMAGSLWKVTESAQAQYPMLGIQLRNFVMQTICHRFFAAPGAGLQTKPIYHLLRMHWHRMNHYYRVNHSLPSHKLVKGLCEPQEAICGDVSRVVLRKIEKHEAEQLLSMYDFDGHSDYVPFKDKSYILHRYFNYPFYTYDVYLVEVNLPSFDNENGRVFPNLVVCRRAFAIFEQGESVEKVETTGSAYRIVDFLGREEYLPDVLQALTKIMMDSGDEYLDFVCHGFDSDLLLKSGMSALDFDSQVCIVPNFFEPLIRKNVPVYSVSTETSLIFRQCKADGDQDRPNGFSVKGGLDACVCDC
jgi:hypothetical protein